MSAQTTPLPCPRCEGGMSVFKYPSGKFVAECEKCDHEGPGAATELAAIRAHNRRAVKP